MKALAIGVLFAVTVVSLSGCHWRHRRWHDRYHRHYSSYMLSGENVARDVRMISSARGV